MTSVQAWLCNTQSFPQLHQQRSGNWVMLQPVVVVLLLATVISTRGESLQGTLSHTSHGAPTQDLHAPHKAAAAADLAAAAAAPTAVTTAGLPSRLLRAVVDPQVAKSDRASLLSKIGSRVSYMPDPFAITSVSMTVSITRSKVTVTNTMEIRPYNSSSCKPVRRAGAADNNWADSDVTIEAAASNAKLDSSQQHARKHSVARLMDRAHQAASSSSNGRRAHGKAICMVRLDLDMREVDVLAVWLDGKLLPPHRVDKSKPWALSIADVPAQPFTVKIMSKTHPSANAARQQGLFIQDGYYASNFEPFGLHRLTPYIDRPDVQPLWTVRLEADVQQLPVLLSNGRLVEQGKLLGGRHFAVWKDPRPHPSYQTTINAGRLALREDTYTSCLTGKTVKFKVYLPPERILQADFAMYAVKAALTWFETAWSTPYKQDAYTMVGQPHLSGEAGEASQMAVFNMNFLTATPESRTDKDAEAALKLIAHEIFHTWAGNYVTVAGWFDLTLKEGLTSYLEHSFAADMDTAEAAAMGLIKPQPAFKPPSCQAAGGTTRKPAGGPNTTAAGVLPWQELEPHLRAVAACRGGWGGCGGGGVDLETANYSWRRIADVAYLRKSQLPEDDGYQAHPLRLTSTSRVLFPYTHTIYRKGAEVVRMYRTMMGPAAFAKGLHEWFSRFYGKAATIDDFHATMAAASPGALPAHWLTWYDQPGTPWVFVEPHYDSRSKTLRLSIEQGNAVVEDDGGYPGVTYSPLQIPLKVGLLRQDGANLPLQLQHSTPGSKVLAFEAAQTALLLLNARKATFLFSNVAQAPVVSVLRGFSAPVRVWVDRQTADDLAIIAQHDNDMFSRYNAIDRLLTQLTIKQLYLAAAEKGLKADDTDGFDRLLEAAGGIEGVPEALIQTYKAVLAQDLPGGTKAYMLSVPTMQELEANTDELDHLLMWKLHQHVGRVLARELTAELHRVLRQADMRASTLPARGFNGPAMQARHTANNALRMLAFDWSPQLEEQVKKRYYTSAALSTRLAALQLLVNNAAEATADAALAHYRKTYAQQPSAMYEWLRVQGLATRPHNIARLRRLLSTPGLVDLHDLDAVDALLGEGGFASNTVNAKAADGSGYEFLVDAVLKVDKVAPQAAATLLASLGDSNAVLDLDALPRQRRRMARAQLQRLADAKPSLSQELQDTLSVTYQL